MNQFTLDAWININKAEVHRPRYLTPLIPQMFMNIEDIWLFVILHEKAWPYENSNDIHRRHAGVFPCCVF